MSMGKIGATVAATVVSKAIGGSDKKTSTEVDFPPWLENNLQATANNLAGSPVPQLNIDELTAAFNPYIMDALGQAGMYSQGAGQAQVDAINQMGLDQAAVAQQLEGLAGMQGQYGAGALDSAGGFLMNELAKAGGGGYSGMGGAGAAAAVLTLTQMHSSLSMTRARSISHTTT